MKTNNKNEVLILKLANISPFIRYALEFTYSPKNSVEYIARDCRLFYIIDGECEIHFKEEFFALTAGSILLFKAGIPYSFKLKNPVRIISINFDYSSKYQCIKEPLSRISSNTEHNANTEILINEITDCDVLNRPIFSNALSKTHEIIKKIVIEHNSNNYLSDEIASTLLKECILQLVRGASTNRYSSYTTHKFNKIIRYIHENYLGDVSNKTLAELVGYHPYYLNRIWKKTYGKTLHEYVLDYKLSIAEQLLITGDESIEELAKISGFSSYVSFNENFKTKYSLSPSKYRKKFGAS